MVGIVLTGMALIAWFVGSAMDEDLKGICLSLLAMAALVWLQIH